MKFRMTCNNCNWWNNLNSLPFGKHYDQFQDEASTILSHLEDSPRHKITIEMEPDDRIV